MNIWQEHVEYLKDNPEGFWFKRKLYGFGWVPAKPAGWIVLGVYIIGVAVFVWQVAGSTGELAKEQSVILLLATVLFLSIVWRTGESLKWQWGKKSLSETDDVV